MTPSKDDDCCDGDNSHAPRGKGEHAHPQAHDHGAKKPHAGRKHFLAVVSKEEAERTWYAQIRPEPLGSERVFIAEASGRTLAEDVTAAIDLPPFDRAVVDGFAVQARDTF